MLVGVVCLTGTPEVGQEHKWTWHISRHSPSRFCSRCISWDGFQLGKCREQSSRINQAGVDPATTWSWRLIVVGSTDVGTLTWVLARLGSATATTWSGRLRLAECRKHKWLGARKIIPSHHVQLQRYAYESCTTFFLGQKTQRPRGSYEPSEQPRRSHKWYPKYS